MERSRARSFVAAYRFSGSLSSSVFPDNRCHRLRNRGPLERLLSGRHLVQDQPQRKLVRPRINRCAARLLRAHVRHRSQYRARIGAEGHGHGRLLRQKVADFRDPEVENLHTTGTCQHDVFRLQVAMRDPGSVRRGEAVGDLRPDVNQLARGNRSALDERPQRLAFDQLGNDVGDVALLADVVNGNDVGMVERAGRPRLLFKPRAPRRVAGKALRQNLHRDLAAEPGIPRAEDFAHAAGPKGCDDLVGSQTGPSADGHERV
jgi:hypothetical protein